MWVSVPAIRYLYIAFQITSLTIVYSAVYSGTNQRKHQRSASLAFVGVIHRWPVNSPHKWPVTRKMFHLMTSSWPTRLIFTILLRDFVRDTLLAMLKTLFRLLEVNLSHDDVFIMIKVNKRVSSDILVKLWTGKYHSKGGFNPTSKKKYLTYMQHRLRSTGSLLKGVTTDWKDEVNYYRFVMEKSNLYIWVNVSTLHA